MTQTLTTERLREIAERISPSLRWGEAEQIAAELLANREAQPVPSGENCWSCGKFFTYAQHSECDGYCPHCNAPVDLDEEEIGDEA